jgi:hypothetical protein
MPCLLAADPQSHFGQYLLPGLRKTIRIVREYIRADPELPGNVTGICEYAKGSTRFVGPTLSVVVPRANASDWSSLVIGGWSQADRGAGAVSGGDVG